MDEDELQRIEAAVKRCDEWLSEGTGDHFAEAFGVLDLVAEVRRLREALVRYGTHTRSCTANDLTFREAAPCTCGWDATVAPLLTPSASHSDA